ncbi:MAG: SH3 domain-containing protein [Acinetobacter sp.]|nr:SH3 domain-containing protein [Acinetobacter sp.]
MKTKLFALGTLLCSFAVATPAVANQAYAGHHYGYVSTDVDGYIILRTAPKANAKRIAKLYDGTQLRILNCSGQKVQRFDRAAYGDVGSWCKVSAHGRVGYVFSKYINFHVGSLED